MEPSQLHLIYKLESMRQIILNTKDVAAMMDMGQKAYDISFPVPIDPEFGYRIEGKQRILSILANEIRTYRQSNTEPEVIQFQISSTILMLMLQFIGGSLSEMEELLRRDGLGKTG